jgi:2-dehydro-3-deoxygalactonokinase
LLKIALTEIEGKQKARNLRETESDPVAGLLGLRAIALDGGTTNTRARLIRDGEIVVTARREVGVRDAALGSSADSAEDIDDSHPRPGGSRTGASTRFLAEAVRGAIAEVMRNEETRVPDLIVAAGMLSSELGLLAVPHVVAPAGLAELSESLVVRTIPEVSPTPVCFVPGVRTPALEGLDGWTRADVMRGEECETLGALAELTQRGELDSQQEGLVFVWPGSHTKLVALDRLGRIARSQTTLAGEMIQAVARQTLIKASLPAALPQVLEPEAVAAGARAAEQQGLARAAFLVRIAAIEGTLDAEQRAAFWISAVVTDDVSVLAGHPILTHARWVGVGGREPLRGLYANALTPRISAPVKRLEDDLCERSSALGALGIALSRIERQGQSTLSPR